MARQRVDPWTVIATFGGNQQFTQPHRRDGIEDGKAGPVNEFGERAVALAGIKTKKAASMFGDVGPDDRNRIAVAIGNHGAD